MLNFEIPWPQYLGMNNRIPPFDNVDVRRAVSHAIPYQTIIDQVMFGYASELKSPVATGMPTSDYSFWAYDGGPAKAKEILDGLGIVGLLVRYGGAHRLPDARADRGLDSVGNGRGGRNGQHSQDDRRRVPGEVQQRRAAGVDW